MLFSRQLGLQVEGRLSRNPCVKTQNPTETLMGEGGSLGVAASLLTWSPPEAESVTSSNLDLVNPRWPEVSPAIITQWKERQEQQITVMIYFLKCQTTASECCRFLGMIHTLWSNGCHVLLRCIFLHVLLFIVLFRILERPLGLSRASGDILLEHLPQWQVAEMSVYIPDEVVPL